MSKTTIGSPAATPKRNPALVTLDIVAAVVFVVIGLVLSLVVVVQAGLYPPLLSSCGAGPYEGLTCNSGFLNVAIIVMSAIAIFAFAIGAGMVVVNLIRRRAVWYWPLLGIVVTIVGFYLGTYLVSLTAPVLG
jgi:uncharacterized BrkB/YihY/UPF0761 family membrane protein